ncbi:MAG: hypothetical protein WCV88_03910 [Patescibacteria group bacterium]
MEPSLVHEKIETAVELDQVDLIHLPWGEPQATDYNNGKIYQTEQTIRFKGMDILLKAKKTEIYKTDPSSYVFSLEKDTETIDGVIIIHYASTTSTSTEVYAHTSIIRNKEKGASLVIPNGAGVTLYKQMLSALQQLANDKRIPIRHIVTRITDFRNDNPLSRDRWNETFMPILENNDYQPVYPNHDSGMFTKTYQPQIQ